MKKGIKSIIMLLVVIVCSYLYAHVDVNTMLYDKKLDTSEYKRTGILNDGELSQEFVCYEDILDGVAVKCTISGDVSKVVLEYKIIEDATGREVEGKINASEISNSKFCKLKIKQLSNCRNKKYTFILKEVGADGENGIIFHYEGKREDNTNFMVNQQMVEGTLIAKTFSHRFDLETFTVFFAFIIYIVLFMKALYKLFE